MFNFPKSKFKVTKKDGTSFEMQALEATKGKMIAVEHQAIKPNIIERGDIVEAFYSNGTSNIYRVVEPNFYEKTGPIPAHYQIKIERNEGKRTINSGINNTGIYNTGNGNVIINSDSPNSNIQIIQDLSKFDEIKNIIQNKTDIDNKEVLLQILEELKNSTEDKNKFLDNYNKFVANLANHVAIITPFIPYLATFLPS